MLFSVFRKAGTDPTKVIAGLNHVSNYPGVVGSLSWTHTQHDATRSAKYYSLVSTNLNGTSTPLGG